MPQAEQREHCRPKFDRPCGVAFAAGQSSRFAVSLPRLPYISLRGDFLEFGASTCQPLVLPSARTVALNSSAGFLPLEKPSFINLKVFGQHPSYARRGLAITIDDPAQNGFVDSQFLSKPTLPNACSPNLEFQIDVHLVAPDRYHIS